MKLLSFAHTGRITIENGIPEPIRGRMEEMEYLRIQNEGEIDISALMLIGATDKAGQDGKIGFFGSGNKYAMATLLRNNCELRIFCGTHEYPITTKKVQFRGEEYEQILVDGKETSITTRMGPGWEVWMALREIYCNAVDEGLVSFGTVQELEGLKSGRTSFFVSMTEQVRHFVDNIGEYINQQEPLESHETAYGRVDIIDNQEGVHYRKNIRAKSKHGLSLYSYNHEEIEINESRIIDSGYTAEEQMACALAMSRNSEIVNNYLRHCLDTKYLEHGARWEKDYCKDNLSETWEECLLAQERPVISESMAALISSDVFSYCVLPDTLALKVQRDLPNVPTYGNMSKQYIEAEPSKELKEKVEKCVKELLSWGHEEKDIIYCRFACKETCGMVSCDTIYISVDLPFKEVMPTLYEEYVHIETGYKDFSRELQTFLFEEVIKLNRIIYESRKQGVEE